MPKISVLIPVYNSGKYIERCIQSVLLQTFHDFEIVIADDGSTDNSFSIIEKYAKSDSRIRIYKKNNEGISTTRNFLVDHSEGDYIQFIDSDDWIEPNMLEEMFAFANKYNLDIVSCNFINEYKRRHVIVDLYSNCSKGLVSQIVSGTWAVLWRMLFKRDICISNSIRFPNGVDGGEDYFFIVSLFLSTSNVSAINGNYYHYNRINTSSFISTSTIEKVKYQIKATGLVEDLLKKQGVDQKYNSELLQRKVSVKKQMLMVNLREGKNTFPEINYSLNIIQWCFIKIKSFVKSILF